MALKGKAKTMVIKLFSTAGTGKSLLVTVSALGSAHICLSLFSVYVQLYVLKYSVNDVSFSLSAYTNSKTML